MHLLHCRDRLHSHLPAHCPRADPPLTNTEVASPACMPIRRTTHSYSKRLHLLLEADLASCTAGVAESVLARVLDAFQAHMNGLLSGSAVQGLVANGTLARLMAAEPAASLAGDPVAFFAGRPGDSIDAFVTEVVTAGGGTACRMPHRHGRGCATTSKYMPVAVVL